jgi:capsular polysaccharide biosynthesis protein
MQIDVSDKNLNKVTEIANHIAKSFPDHEIRIKQTGERTVMKIYPKKPVEVAPAPLAV